ncbi:tight junction protein ZO-1-like isoform X3 [Thrips palmi]|uniref:Tight junction protein ZO-1-like isoform X3 n=1 Tax=Thrips palmi TaxID=161013 RepID=A0A6P8YLE0_THRPL|nr:tight junction protein ZO-1-like isoform X3 [Thrips palmi]
MDRDAPNSSVLSEGAIEQSGERIVWESHHVTLTRVPGYGFGIAVSGGKDNPHFTSGDPAIAISDVLKAGPAEGKLQVNDRIVSANGVSLENVDYATAVQVLRDSGNTALLVVRRRIVLPASPEPHTLKVQLQRNKKKDDFGIVLGCKIYVREVLHRDKDGLAGAGPGNSLQEGDVLLKINNHSADGLSLKEARKLMDASKEKLSLLVRREARSTSSQQSSNGNLYGGPSSHNNSSLQSKDGNLLDSLAGGTNYSSQNLYVQPPTRGAMAAMAAMHPHQSSLLDDKSNLLPRGRSRVPLPDHVSLSQLDRPSTPSGAGAAAGPSVGSNATGANHNHSRSRSGIDDADGLSPPRPPPPRPEGEAYDFYSSRRQLYEEDPLLQRKQQQQQPMPDPRFVTFQKEGSVGIRLTGGNEVGVFVTAVQPGSPASLQGLQPGDKILKVNDMDMKGVTREEAVLFLLSLQDQIDLIVQHRKDEYDTIVAGQRGDSFHIKAHFNYDQPNKGEMSFRKGDVFHVVDTLHNGVVGSWQVFRIGRNNTEVQKGIIPNKARAEELATAQFNASKKEQSTSESRGSFFRRRRNSHRRSKSLGRDHWDDVVFADSISKFPAYERVVLRHPGFVRPVVLFGPVADIARDKMLRDFPDKFSSPQLENGSSDVPKSQKASGIIRLSAIRDIMDRGKHALLDITPNAVDRLNYAQFYPIVIFLRAESKQTIKEVRAGAGLSNTMLDILPWTAHKSSKKLLEQCQKLEKVWGHVFSSSVTLSSPESWYRKVRELVDKQQQTPVWMSESKPDEALSDDFLFPMTSRLSYASSPESDLDLSPEPRPHNHNNSGLSSGGLNSSRLVKSSSDPSIATVEDGAPGYTAPPPYSPANSYNKQNSNGPPELPPRIDRNIKPPRVGLTRSATDRLYPSKEMEPATNGTTNGSPPSPVDPPNYINATPHHLRTSGPNSSLDRHIVKTSSYDSVSSYDSYNNRVTLGQNSHDDLKQCNGGPASPRNHDPYRFTRSTAQPIGSRQNSVDPPKANKPPDYSKYRPGEYNHNKPLPPPKTTSYKPIPPPKPKNYRLPSNGQSDHQPNLQTQWRNPANGGEQTYGTNENTPQRPNKLNLGMENGISSPLHHSNNSIYQHSKSFSLAGGMESHHNGIIGSPGKFTMDQENNNYTPNHNNNNNHSDHNGGFDSGHGSSLDRNYDRSGPQYYYNMPPPPARPGPGHHNREPSGLDLANREQRGSAFELYKKPSDPRYHYMEHSISNGRHCDVDEDSLYSNTAGWGNGTGSGAGGSINSSNVNAQKSEVVATARGVFSAKGGVLENPETGVSIVIPPGALPPDSEQEIYFKVCRDSGGSLVPPLDKERGETLLSPLVMCGPNGLKFNVPVELRLPHTAAPSKDNSWGVALKSTEVGNKTTPTKWHQMSLGNENLHGADGSNSVSVLVDHF